MTLTTKLPLHQNYIPALDGLRGIAILMVISFHYFNQYTPIFSLGWSGVDLFFVLSGYLITSRLIYTFDKPHYFYRFYKNRALRILPLLYGVLIAFYLIIFLLISKSNLPGFQFYKDYTASFFLFFQNWSLMDHSNLAENHLEHFWSLAVEEQFYLIWPFFIYFFSKSKYLNEILITWIFCVITLRTTVFFLSPADYKVYFYNSFCRMDGFIVGAMLFFIHEKRIKSFPKYILIPLIFLLTAGLLLDSHLPYGSVFIPSIGLTLLAVFYGILMHFAIKKKYRVWNSILNLNWLIYIGRISYGLYIFHWLVLRFLSGYISKYLGLYTNSATSTNEFIALFICLAITFGISIISFRYYESYFLRLKRR
jgi:peptidoglycan/LPS O-acetylase OafA/YrhL